MLMMHGTILLIFSFAAPTSAFAPAWAGQAHRTAPSISAELGSSASDSYSSSSDGQQLGLDRRSAISAAMAAMLTAASPTYAKGPKNSVYFSNVNDGDTVPRKFTYKFEVTGYELSPAADGLKEGTGHHHLVIDGPKAFVDKGEPIPFDATHKHFGKAQTEGELELEPGKHKITLQFANANHESYGKEFSQTITVNVDDA